MRKADLKFFNQNGRPGYRTPAGNSVWRIWCGEWTDGDHLYNTPLQAAKAIDERRGSTDTVSVKGGNRGGAV